MRDKLVHAVEEIKSVLASVYEIFRSDSEEVQREWVKYTNKVDKKMEDALRFSIKKSLQVGSVQHGAGGGKRKARRRGQGVESKQKGAGSGKHGAGGRE